MQKIYLRTMVNAPLETCFDLARSIDLHVKSMEKSNEQAIAGKTSGLIHLNETVTWKAKHLGINFVMTNKITELVKPSYFVDEMVNGPFSFLKHQHHFKNIDQKTEMIDVFEFKAPFGILGWLAEKVFLRNYMKKLLLKRNFEIRMQAER